MAQLNISVNPREEVGRGSNHRLRSAGKIPGVIYSKGESRAISIDNKEFAKLWSDLIGHTPLVTITEGKDEVLALIQEVQRHPIKDYFIHVDFHEVTRGEEITAHASIHVIGEPIGVKNEGGSLETHLHEVEIRSSPGDIPDFIEVDVSNLKVGDAIHVSELPELKGVTYMVNADTQVVSVSGAMREVEPADVAAVEEAEASKESAETSEKEES